MIRSPRFRPLARLGTLAAVALAGLTCRDGNLTGPGLPIKSWLSVAPVLQTTAPGGPDIQLDRVRAVLYTRTTPPDSIVVIAPFQGDSAVIQFDVTISGASELFDVRLAAIDAAGDTAFRGADTVRAYPTGTPGAPAGGLASIHITYARPDANVTAIQVAPRDTTIDAGASIPFRVTGTTAQGTQVPTLVGWTSRDPAGASITSAGTLTASQLQTSVWVVATAFNGTKDSTRVFINGSVATVTAVADSVQVARGDSVQLGVVLRDLGGTVLAGRSVTWSALGAAVSVGPTGMATGLAANQVGFVIGTVAGKSDTIKVVVAPRPVAKLVAVPDTLRLLVGQTLQLQATALDAQNAPNADSPLAFASDDPLVAGLSLVGGGASVVGLAAGQTAITVSSGGVSLAVPVFVSPVPVATTVVSPKTLTLVTGDSAQLSAATLDSIGGALLGRAVGWTSLDPSRATVDANGKVRTVYTTSLTPGTARIVVAAATGKPDTATITITPAGPASVAITPRPTGLAFGDSVILAAVVRDAEGAALPGRPLVFTSRDPAKATVNQSGKVRAAFNGGAVGDHVWIVAASGAVADSVDIALVPVAPAAIDVTPAAPAMTAGATQQLAAAVTDALGRTLTGRPVAWTALDASVSVDAAGLVTALATITQATTGRVAATLGALADTATASIAPAAVASVVVSPPAATVTEGASVPLAVAVTDANGNPLPASAATWSSLDVNKATVDAAGLVQTLVTGVTAPDVVGIVAAAGGKADTAFITRTPGPSRLVFQVAPGSPVAGAVIAPAVTVAVTDVNGVVFAGSTAAVTLAIATGPNGAVLGGTLTANAAAGVATFADLTLDRAGSYTLRATATGLASATTTAFTVVAGAAATVVVTPARATVVTGAQRQLQASATDAKGNLIQNPALAWSSLAPAKATVSATGLVQTVFNGGAAANDSVLIVATATGGAADTATIVMTPSAVASLVLAPDPVSIAFGDSVQLAATLKDAQGRTLTGRPLTFTSLDPAKAAVDAAGKVRSAFNGGTVADVVLIEARSGAARDTVAVALTPAVPAALTVSPKTPAVAAGGTQQLAAAVTDALGRTLTGRTVVWTALDTTVTVSSTGLATAKGTITAAATGRVAATLGALADTATLAITPAAVGSVTVSPASASVTEGQQVQLSASAKDANGNAITPVFTWTSADPAKATVDAAGLVQTLVTGVTGPDVVDIIASAGGKADTAHITRTPGPSKLVFQVVPGSPVAGVAITPSLRVAVTDVNGVVFATSTAPITLAIATGPNGATLGGTLTRSAVAGRATFAGLVIDKAGQYTLTATSAGLASATTATFTVAPGAAASVVVAPKRTTVAFGDSVQLAVTAQDAQGNPIAGPSATFTSLSPAKATVTAAGKVRTAFNGGAQPDSVKIVATIGTVADTATVLLAPVAPAAIAVSPKTPAVAAGGTQQLAAAITDALGRTLTGRTVVWSALDTTVTVSATGLATAKATITQATTGRIVAALGALADTATVSVAPAAVGSVVVSPPTASVTEGGSVQLSATVTDANGNAITPLVTWASLDATKATVGATSGLVQTLVTGVAGPDVVGIVATAGGKADTAFITRTPGPSKLVFQVAPGLVGAGVPIAPQLQVAVTDVNGVVFTGSTASITLAIGTGPNGATLGGTLTRVAVNGVASFPGLTLDKSGQYTLTATATGLAPATTAAFTVASGPPAAIALSPKPTSLAYGTTQQFTATVTDAVGNVVTTKVAFSSSDANVATITAGGLLTATGVGTVTVTATAGNLSDAVTFAVTGSEIIVGFDATRGGKFSPGLGAYTSEARTELANTFNGIAYRNVPTLTAQALAGAKMAWILAWTDTPSGSVISPLTAAEQAALHTFVVNGGCAVIVTDGNTTTAELASNNSVIAPFGLSMVSGVAGNTASRVVTPSSSLVLSWAFGTVTSITHNNPGSFASYGPWAARLDTNGVGNGSLAWIDRDQIAAGSGGVTILADHFPIRNTAPSGAGSAGGFQANRVLFRNAANLCMSPPFVVSSVAVSALPASFLIGDVAQLTATPSNVSNGVLTGRQITWSSSNPAVATVSSTGLVTAVGTGPVTITAKAGQASGSASTTVGTPVVLAGFDAARGGSYAIADPSTTGFATARSLLAQNFPGIRLRPLNSLTAGGLTGVKAVIVNTWTDNSNNIIPLTTAEQTALKNFVLGGGCAVLLADGTNGPVNVPVYTSVLGPFGLSIAGNLGGSHTAAVASPAASLVTSGRFGNVTSVTHSFSGAFGLGADATAFATTALGSSDVWIDRDRLAAGSGPVIAYGDVNTIDNGNVGTNQTLWLNTLDLCLNPPVQATSVAVTTLPASFVVGDSARLTATVRNGGTVLAGRQVIWTSSNPAVATVSSTGMVTAVGAGPVTITARAGQASGTASATVGTPLILTGFDAARGGIFALATGSAHPEARARISAAFPSARFRGVNTLTTQGLAGAKLVYLASMVDGTNLITPLSAAEQAVLQQFVTGGGCAVVLIDGVVSGASNAANISLVAPFGVTQGGLIQGDIQLRITNPAASALTNGPFGRVDSLHYFWMGGITGLGSNASSLADTQIGSGLAWLDRDQITAGSGMVVALTDVGPFEGTATTGLILKADNAKMLLNTVSFCASPPAAVTSVTVAPASKSLLVGAQQQLTATLVDAAGGAGAGRQVLWSSSNPAVATVDASGNVSAVAQGTATITAKAGGKTATSAITVIPPVTSLAITASNDSLFSIGDTLYFHAQAFSGRTPVAGTFAWSVHDAGSAAATFASIGAQSGLLTALKNGDLYVVATETASGVKDSMLVSVAQQVATVTVSPPTATVPSLGVTTTFTASAFDALGNAIAGRTFSWSLSAGSNVAQILKTTATTADVQASANGTVSVTATTAGATGAGAVSGSASLTVQQVLASIVLGPTPLQITRQQQVQMQAQGEDANGFPMNVSTFTWTTSNNKAATVNASGVVTGVAAGTAQIRARNGTIVSNVAAVTVTNGARVLILPDAFTPTIDTLVAVLTRAGHGVTVAPVVETQWDGTNPGLANFDVVVHLKGATYSLATPGAGQDSLEAFVARGHGYIGSQWLGYARDQGIQTRMPNLILQRYGLNTGDDNCSTSAGQACAITLTTVSGQSGHPVLAGIPSSFTDNWEGFSSGRLFAYRTDIPVVLMTSNSGGPAVTVRQITGAGRVVNFAIAVNYPPGIPAALYNTNVHRLYVNAVSWVR